MRHEAAVVLFALDAAMESHEESTALYRQLQSAAQILIEKFLPDLPDL